MKMSPARTIALDLSVGCLAFLFAIIVTLFLHTIHNVSFFFLGASALLFVAGYVRAIAQPLSPWMNGLLVSLGVAIPIFLFGTALSLVKFGPKSAAFVLFLAVVCAIGAQARSWRKASRPIAASVISITLFTAVFLLGKFAIPHLIEGTTSQAINKPAPEFTLTMLDGKPVSLELLRGHVVVLDFWGTWCAPCLAELPALGSVYDHYKSNPDVVFILVNSGTNGDTAEKVRTFTDKHHLQIPVGLDDTRANESIGARVLPYLIVLDKHGNIRMQNSGYQDAEKLSMELTQKIEFLLQAN